MAERFQSLFDTDDERKFEDYSLLPSFLKTRDTSTLSSPNPIPTTKRSASPYDLHGPSRDSMISYPTSNFDNHQSSSLYSPQLPIEHSIDTYTQQRHADTLNIPLLSDTLSYDISNNTANLITPTSTTARTSQHTDENRVSYHTALSNNQTYFIPRDNTVITSTMELSPTQKSHDSLLPLTELYSYQPPHNIKGYHSEHNDDTIDNIALYSQSMIPNPAPASSSSANHNDFNNNTTIGGYTNNDSYSYLNIHDRVQRPYESQSEQYRSTQSPTINNAHDRQRIHDMNIVSERGFMPR